MLLQDIDNIGETRKQTGITMDFASRLNMLLEVVECGSFTKAADRIHIDRSSLSKQIKKLESTLGVRLLNRSTRSIALTCAGREIVNQAKKMRELLNETEHIANSFHHEPKGHLKISSPTMFGRLYLQKAIELYLIRYPQASIKMILDDQKVNVISEGFSIVFRTGKLSDSDMVAKKLADNRFILIASESFVSEYGVPNTPEELVKLPAVIYSNNSFRGDRLHISKNSSPEGLLTYSMEGRYKVNESELVIESVKQGLGYALVRQCMLTKPLKELGLLQLLPNYTIPTHSNIYALYPHRNQQPLVNSFIDTVQEVIGTPPVWEDNF